MDYIKVKEWVIVISVTSVFMLGFVLGWLFLPSPFLNKHTNETIIQETKKCEDAGMIAFYHMFDKEIICIPKYSQKGESL